MDRVFPSMQWIISFAVSISMLNSAACGILSASRFFYSASQEGQLPLIFSMLNSYHCPVVAVTKIIIFSSIAVIPSSLVNLIKYLMLLTLVLTELNMISLLKLRHQEPHLHRPYKVNQNSSFKFPFILYEQYCFHCVRASNQLWYQSSKHLLQGSILGTWINHSVFFIM